MVRLPLAPHVCGYNFWSSTPMHAGATRNTVQCCSSNWKHWCILSLLYLTLRRAPAVMVLPWESVGRLACVLTANSEPCPLLVHHQQACVSRATHVMCVCASTLQGARAVPAVPPGEARQPGLHVC